MVRLQLAAALVLFAGSAVAQPAAAPTPTSGGSATASTAVPAATPSTAPASTSIAPTADDDPKVKKAFAAMLDTCGPDLRLYCAGIPFGDADFGLCIRENYTRMSFTCQSKLRHMPRVLPGLNENDRGLAPLPAQSKIR